MKSFCQLNRDELIELKQNYYTAKHSDGVSWGEFADIDNLVSDEEIENEYGEFIFSDDDFVCNCK